MNPVSQRPRLVGLRATVRLAVAGMVAFTAAGSAVAADGAKVTFEEHVLPIFRQHCMGCHQPGKTRGDFDASSYQGIMSGSSSGEIVQPGDPDNSKLFLVTAHLAEPKMPPKADKIPQKDIDILKAWIAGGLIEKAGGAAKASKKPKMELAAVTVSPGKPSGPVAMPQDLVLEPVITPAKPGSILGIAASPWAPIVAVAVPRQVVLYHSVTNELLGVLPFPEGMPNVVKFSRNGDLLLVAGGRPGASGKAVVFQVKDGKRVTEVGDEKDAILAADISADHSQIALGGVSKLIMVYSTKTGELIRSIKKHTEWVTALEYSPDGVLLGTGDRNGGLMVWEANTGGEFYNLRSHTAAITDITWRADSNVIGSASEDGTLRLWEMQNGNQVKGWGAHGGGVASFRIHHDGRMVSCGRDRVVKIWDPAGNQQRQLDAFSDAALKVVFSHDGQRVIAGDWLGEIRVTSAADGKLIDKLASNPPPVQVALAQNQQRLKESEAAAAPKRQAFVAAEANAKKLTEELAAAKKLAVDTMAGFKAGEAKLAAEVAKLNGLKAGYADAEKKLAAAKAEEPKLVDLAGKAKAAWEKVTADSKTLADELAMKNKAATDALAAAGSAKAAADKMGGDKALADAAKAAREMADKLAGMTAESKKKSEVLAAEVKKLADDAAAKKAGLDKLQADIAAMAKALPVSLAAVQAQEKVFAAVQTETNNLKVAMDNAAKAVPGKEQGAKAAGDALAKAKGEIDAADGAIRAAARQVARYEAAKINIVFAKAKEELAKEEARLEEIAAKAAEMKAAADRTAGELAATEKFLADAANLTKARDGEIAKEKAGVTAAEQVVAQVQAVVAAKDGVLKQLAGLAGSTKAEADKAKDNKELAQALAKLTEANSLLAADVENAKKVVAAKLAELEAAKGKMVAAEKAKVQLLADLAAAPKKIEGLKVAMKTATENLAKASADVDAFRKAQIDPAKAKVEKLAAEYASAARAFAPVAN